MPRSCTYDVPVDTGFFTPLHLQPAVVCRLAFNGAGRWLSRHAISHRRLVAEHRTGFVYWSVELATSAAGEADCVELLLAISGG